MSGRIEVLDVARGLAIVGTLATNVWVFAAPGGPAGPLLGDGVVEELLRAPFNGTSLALLSLLFGIGLELQHRAARERGLTRPRRYLRRCAVLGLEGAVHYVLVFEYDVLLAYAVVAMLVTALAGCSTRTRTVIAVAVGAVHVAMIGMLTAAMVAVPQAAAVLAGPVLPGAQGVYDDGSWGAQVALRLAAWPVFRVELLLLVPLGVVLFLVGGALVRGGWFDAARVSARRRVAALGLGVALPLTVALSLAGSEWFAVARYLVAPVVALGVLAALTEAVAAGRLRRARGPLADLGRTALSGYVLQNVLTSALCYGWGLGLGATMAGLSPAVRPWSVVALWAGVSAVVLTAAVLWRRHFAQGPMEALAARLVAGTRAVPVTS